MDGGERVIPLREGNVLVGPAGPRSRHLSALDAQLSTCPEPSRRALHSQLALNPSTKLGTGLVERACPELVEGLSANH